MQVGTATYRLTHLVSPVGLFRGENIPHGTRRITGGIAFCTISLAGCFLLARHLTSASWPLQKANLVFVLAASCAYLASFGFRALGWHRVFPIRHRPDRARCLAACGASAASGTVLPFRLDYFVKIATLRRLRGIPLGLDTIVLSIVTLGLVDAVAMLPLAIAAISTSGSLFLAPLMVVILWCMGCIGILIAGPRLIQLPLLRRWQRTRALCQRVGESATITRSTFIAGGFLFGCWTSRALGSVFLLMALGAGFSPTLALVILCLSAAAAVVPITAGGAVAHMGATAGILFALGASKDVAINFALASGLLLTLAALAAALVGIAGSLVLTFQGRRTLAASYAVSSGSSSARIA
ncbi:MAG TPA: lysylphosphatidylglycerol synthase domain-containing protein [Actinomycetota bacterium]|nr:lysylphosphatidylglycerol synthase domain-containing protein [Actinomycetota bacterium]